MDPNPERSNGRVIPLWRFNVAWARRAEMVSYLPPLGAGSAASCGEKGSSGVQTFLVTIISIFLKTELE